MNTTTKKQAESDAILAELNRQNAARRRAYRRHAGGRKEAASCLGTLLLAYVIGCGCWTCAKFLLSLIY